MLQDCIIYYLPVENEQGIDSNLPTNIVNNAYVLYHHQLEQIQTVDSIIQHSMPLNQLKILDLQHQNLVNADFANELNCVTELNLSGNRLQKFRMTSSAIAKLNLSHNSLDTVLITSTSLHTLILEKNGLMRLNLTAAPNLDVLDVSSNPQLGLLQICSQLSNIDCSQTDVDVGHIGLGMLQNCSHHKKQLTFSTGRNDTIRSVSLTLQKSLDLSYADPDMKMLQFAFALPIRDLDMRGGDFSLLQRVIGGSYIEELDVRGCTVYAGQLNWLNRLPRLRCLQLNTKGARMMPVDCLANHRNAILNVVGRLEELDGVRTGRTWSNKEVAVNERAGEMREMLCKRCKQYTELYENASGQTMRNTIFQLCIELDMLVCQVLSILDIPNTKVNDLIEFGEFQ